MWVVLRQVVNVGRVGTSQLKDFSNLTCCGVRRTTCIARIHQSGLCTQAVKLQDQNPNMRIQRKSALERIGLNPKIGDVPYILTKDQEELVTRGQKKQLLAELWLHLQMYREIGKDLPKSIKLEDLSNMLNLSYHKTIRYLNYLIKTEHKIESQARQKAAKLIAREKWINEKHELRSKLEHPWLDTSNIILPISNSKMRCVYNTNALTGLLFGQRVVIDCSYNDHMDDWCLKLTAKQILFCYYSSRKNRRPFSLHICNLDFDSRLMFYLKKLHPGILEDVPMGIHSKSYLEMFDREKLVYLTPHTHNELNYNPEDIYIIGGFVDKTRVQLSLGKAEKEKIRYASLPLDRYLQWRTGTKSICLHQCLNILLDVKNTGDWTKALQTHVPSRKRFDPSRESLTEN